MKSSPLLFWTLGLILLSNAACGPKPDPDAAVRRAVAATVAAIPAATPYPTFTPYPAPTRVDPGGLFCEYSFCIGHPPEVAFYDVSAVQTGQLKPNTYNDGILAAYSANLFIQVLWQHAPGAADPQFLIDLILEDGLDTRGGKLDIQLIRDMNVLYSPITSTASPMLPFGGVAGWVCGDRVFAWKVYTPDETTAQAMFADAINRFTCSN
ncbi:MAG: hypothetical protein AB1564_01790 [Chloroflexota bacterium]